MKNRILLLFAVFTAVFLFLGYRLFSLQVLNNKELLSKAASQRSLSVPLNNLRGTIYDRDMIPLTGNGEKKFIVVIPQLVFDVQKTAALISQGLQMDYDVILRQIKSNKPFQYSISTQKADLFKDSLPEGVLITTASSRYENNSVAKHIIGYVNSDNYGQYGIEKGYDSFLRRNGFQSVGIISDGNKRPLAGLGFRAVETYSEAMKTNVKLTINYHFQSIVEKAFDEHQYPGAAVLLDVKTGDVLAMVSRPDFDQNDITKYFTSSNKELVNKALYPYNLGSIFKAVVAEAAFENNAVHEGEIFSCPGYSMVDGQMIKCSSYNSGGHPNIDFVNAFAKSCNTTFIQVGLRVGYPKIVETARKFGLGQSAGFDIHGFYEDPGLVRYKQYFSNREVANISIGQGEILVTPLQAANIFSIVANDGIKRKINIVDSIVDDDGKIVKKVRSDEANAVISKVNAQKLKIMMSQVTKTGTGEKAKLEEYGGAAGKTSSAETGMFVGDEQIVHAWFGGYFPEKSPRYAMAVIVENGKLGSQVAAPLFAEIAAKIISTDR